MKFGKRIGFTDGSSAKEVFLCIPQHCYHCARLIWLEKVLAQVEYFVYANDPASKFASYNYLCSDCRIKE